MNGLKNNHSGKTNIMICPTCNVSCNQICPNCYESVFSDWHTTESAMEYAKSVTKKTRTRINEIYGYDLIIRELKTKLKACSWYQFKKIKQLQKEIDTNSIELNKLLKS